MNGSLYPAGEVGSPELMSITDITNRWPGLVYHDIEQAADFVEYSLSTNSDEMARLLEGAEGPVADLLDALAYSAAWSLRHAGETTRADVLCEAAQAVFRHEQYTVVEALQSGDEDRADTAMGTLFGKWQVELEVTYSPSPLFPKGRQEYIPLTIQRGERPDIPQRTKYVVDCYGQKQELGREIVERINNPPRKQEDDDAQMAEIRRLAESVLEFDSKHFEQLRSTYGTKAASLFIFANAVENFRTVVHEDLEVADFIIPKFTAAPVGLHRLYKSGDPQYEALLEEIRMQAVGVSSDQYDPELFRPLVAVRSSAVFSEDGDNASGAGIYASVAADPRDPVAFRKAVETVFDSMDTKAARDYLAEKNIDNEQMGLLIQQYIEDTREYKDTCVYGYVQSGDPFGRFITLSSETGELLFDRSAVETSFMTQPPFGRTQPTFHYNPDHDSRISDFSREGAQLANAALFAEKLFGKQVEVEFACDDSNTAYVVQVRPLPYQEKPQTVEFPTHIEPLVECRAIGVGDLVVTVRDDEEYANDEQTFDWVDSEYETGRSAHRRDKKAVFVIGYNEANSGHIQMLARERGQICLYPSALTALPSGLERELVPDYQLNRVRKYRVVADGYRGAIYPIDEERNALLENIATGIARYIAICEAEIVS